MARIISLSSDVVYGHVGHGASVFALRRLGHEVWPIPTVMLSNHPGHAHVSGITVPAPTIREMIAALDANGWLGKVDAVFSGYMPTAEHADLVVEVLERCQIAGAAPWVVVDPIIGDAPKGLYVAPTVAAAIGERLIPLADLITPNTFELSWLAGSDEATALAHAIGPREAEFQSADQRARFRGEMIAQVSALLRPEAAALVTSVFGADPEEIGTAFVSPANGSAHREVCIASQPLLPHAPHGTGDLFAALFTGWRLSPHGLTPQDALGRAAGALDVLLAGAASCEHELELAHDGGAWVDAPPHAVCAW